MGFVKLHSSRIVMSKDLRFAELNTSLSAGRRMRNMKLKMILLNAQQNWKKIVKKTVKKYTPITGCTKEPRELCAPAGCGFVQGEEECYDKVQTVVQDVPKEECNLEPERSCNYVTKLVPKLTPKLECADVPNEVCTRSRRIQRRN